jgi:hypothetical protein
MVQAGQGRMASDSRVFHSTNDTCPRSLPDASKTTRLRQSCQPDGAMVDERLDDRSISYAVCCAGLL